MGEVIRRIIARCVTLRLQNKIAVHAIHSLFQHEETDAVLLVDVSNAFNSLHRAAIFHNIRILWPALAKYAINSYRAPARLFGTGRKELISAEGTTQGDSLSKCMYAVNLQPLISRLQEVIQAKQCWFTGDATGCGLLQDIRMWWDELLLVAPDLGYYLNVGLS